MKNNKKAFDKLFKLLVTDSNKSFNIKMPESSGEEQQG